MQLLGKKNAMRVLFLLSAVVGTAQVITAIVILFQP